MKHQPPCVNWAVKLSLKEEDLSLEDREALREHVKTCSACAQAQADYHLLIARLRTLPSSNITLFPRLALSLCENQDEKVSIDNDQHDTFRPTKRASRVTRRKQPILKRSFFHKKAPRMASLLAAVWMIGILSGSFLLTTTSQPQVAPRTTSMVVASSSASPQPIDTPNIPKSDIGFLPAMPLLTPTPPPPPSTPPPPTPPFANCASNDAMFGFNACHTHLNPDEQAISPANVAGLTQTWLFHATNVIGASPVVANGVVYVGSIDGIMYAVDAKTGTLKWQTIIGGQIWSTAAIVDGVVYVGSTNGNVDALDAATGHLIWQTPNLGQIESSPTVVNGIAYIGSFDNNLYALDASTGHHIWSFPTRNAIYSSPAVRGNVVYIGSNDGNVYAIDATTGKQKWAYYTGKSVYSSPAISNNIVYVGTASGNAGGDVVAINASTGFLLWKQHVSEEILSSPAIAYGTLYIGSFDHNLYAFDAFTGQLRWTGQTSSYIWTASPTVANGVVFIGSMDANLYAFDTISGQFLQKWSLSNSIYGSPAIANGTVFIGSSSHLLYAFRLPG